MSTQTRVFVRLTWISLTTALSLTAENCHRAARRSLAGLMRLKWSSPDGPRPPSACHQMHQSPGEGGGGDIKCRSDAATRDTPLLERERSERMNPERIRRTHARRRAPPCADMHLISLPLSLGWKRNTPPPPLPLCTVLCHFTLHCHLPSTHGAPTPPSHHPPPPAHSHSHFCLSGRPRVFISLVEILACQSDQLPVSRALHGSSNYNPVQLAGAHVAVGQPL